MSIRREREFALIIGLLLLLVLTLFAVGMFSRSGLQERIAAATRKQRAVEAAQSALQYGEWWLQLNNGGAAVNCTGMGVNSANTLANMQIVLDCAGHAHHAALGRGIGPTSRRP